MTKLKIMVTDTPYGRLLALCDDQGVPLPAQSSIEIVQRPDDICIATVRFIVGEDCPIVGAEP